jgi:hypothetical protein
MYFSTKFHKPSPSDSLVEAIKNEAKESGCPTFVKSITFTKVAHLVVAEN